jgi:hypothetical protein
MNIITISREFGSGGRELGKRVAEILGMEYYDKEIISAIANKQGMDEKYVESASNGQGWRGMALTTRRSFAYLNAGNTATIHILLEEKRALEAIAALKKAIDFFRSGKFTEQEAVALCKSVNKSVCAAIDPLAVVKDNVAYTLGGALDREVE